MWASDAEVLKLFPLGKADEVVQSTSAAYKGAAAALVERANKAAEAAEFEREWQAAKAAKDWKGARAAKAKFDKATAAAAAAAAVGAAAAAQIVSDAEALVASAPLKLLPGLADAYGREADRKGDADDYDGAEAYTEAAEVRVPGFAVCWHAWSALGWLPLVEGGRGAGNPGAGRWHSRLSS